jgi:uncharacterized membrane protein
MKTSLRDPFPYRARRYLIAGVLMLLPLWVTWFVLSLVFGQLSRIGRPWVQTFTRTVEDAAPGLAQFLSHAWLESAVAIVLIDFPAPPLKAVGFVTRVLTDASTGNEVAVVYVPTSANPTSGYMEIVPIDRITPTDWTMDEAMRFIITGGTSAPERISLGGVAPAPR